MSDRLPESSEPPVKRRKVRKGTRSCWECRRRKIKCQFDAPDDALCIGCRQRGTLCRSQEYDDENAPEPGQRSEPPLARRLDRLEQMMERIVDKIVPDDTGARPSTSRRHREVSRARRSNSASSQEDAQRGQRGSSVDVIEAPEASEGPIAALLAMRHESVHRRGPSESGPIPTPALTSVESSTPTLPTTATTHGSGSRPVTSAGGHSFPPLNQHFWVCSTLRAVMPPQSAIESIIDASPGAPYAAALCYSDAERREGRIEQVSSLTVLPPPTAHPLLLAKRALQILICIQQLPHSFDWDALGTGVSMSETMSRLSNSSSLVTTNDELMGFAESIECLILQSWYQASSGSLRRAWVTTRRALGLAQMMGLDKRHPTAFRSCDPKLNPARSTTATGLWFKVVYWDRYLSLLLGFPVGSRGENFGPGHVSEHDSPLDRLEKAHAIISTRISDRNDAHQMDPTQHSSIYALTQDIDLDLEAASSSLPSGWWDEPHFERPGSQESMWDVAARGVAQLHHFTLILLLHVPYMLRDPSSSRYDYSKNTCVAAARSLLRLFISFRTQNGPAYGCRQVDYAGLIAAMSLCLSYLARRKTETWDKSRLQEDSELIESTKRRMEHIARVNKDRLSRETVDVIERLAPLIEKAAASLEGKVGEKVQERDAARDMQFSVPYLGSIYIKTTEGSAASDTDWQGHRRHPSSATGALGRMVLSPTQQAAASLESPQLSGDISFLQFAPHEGQNEPRKPGMEPNFVAGVEDWALQGVDAAYWSLFGEVF